VSRLVIQGGNRLKGTIRISGSKNGSLPLMAASILAEGKVELRNVPRLSDIRHMGEALSHAGMRVDISEEAVAIETEDP